MFLRSSVMIHSAEMLANDPAIVRKLQHKWKNLNMLLMQHTGKSDVDIYAFLCIGWRDGIIPNRNKISLQGGCNGKINAST